MKNILLLLLLTTTLPALAGNMAAKDTIANWQVYNGGRLLKAFNEFSHDKRITLSRKAIKSLDTFGLRYHDDTPCPNCQAKLTIKTDNDKTVKIIDNSINNYYFDIKTADLRLISLQQKSKILKFYYQEDESSQEKLLFALEIK